MALKLREKWLIIYNYNGRVEKLLDNIIDKFGMYNEICIVLDKHNEVKQPNCYYLSPDAPDKSLIFGNDDDITENFKNFLNNEKINFLTPLEKGKVYLTLDI